MSTSLAKREQSAVERAVQKREKNLIIRAARITSTALRAPELPMVIEKDADGNPVIPEGWTLPELRVAMDATKNQAQAPVYLRMAQTAFEAAQKLAAAGRQAPVAAIQIILNQAERPKYDVIDVTSRETK